MNRHTVICGFYNLKSTNIQFLCEINTTFTSDENSHWFSDLFLLLPRNLFSAGVSWLWKEKSQLGFVLDRPQKIRWSISSDFSNTFSLSLSLGIFRIFFQALKILHPTPETFRSSHQRVPWPKFLPFVRKFPSSSRSAVFFLLPLTTMTGA